MRLVSFCMFVRAWWWWSWLKVLLVALGRNAKAVCYVCWEDLREISSNRGLLFVFSSLGEDGDDMALKCLSKRTGDARVVVLLLLVVSVVFLSATMEEALAINREYRT